MLRFCFLQVAIKIEHNGQPLRLTIEEGEWIVASPPNGAVPQGVNRVVLSLDKTADGKSTLVDTMLSVRYPTNYSMLTAPPSSQ